MRREFKTFFKIANVIDVKANRKAEYIIVYCENIEVKLNYNTIGSLEKDITFLNKCRRGEFKRSDWF